MIQLNLVNLEVYEDRYMAEIRADAAHQRCIVHMLHRTTVLIDLLKPLRHTWRTVFTYPYFASVLAVDNLEKIGLHFFRVVKRAKKFLYTY